MVSPACDADTLPATNTRTNRRWVFALGRLDRLCAGAVCCEIRPTTRSGGGETASRSRRLIAAGLKKTRATRAPTNRAVPAVSTCRNQIADRRASAPSCTPPVRTDRPRFPHEPVYKQFVICRSRVLHDLRRRPTAKAIRHDFHSSGFFETAATIQQSYAAKMFLFRYSLRNLPCGSYCLLSSIKSGIFL